MSSSTSKSCTPDAAQSRTSSREIRPLLAVGWVPAGPQKCIAGGKIRVFEPGPATSMSDRWILSAQAGLAFRCWDGESVVHHHLSNDSHRLAEPAGWILTRLTSAGPLATDDLAAGSTYDAADLTPALHALGELGLIHRC